MKSNLTIVFPTFNRGKILLDTIKKLDNENLDSVMVTVLDNASENYSEEYKIVQELSEKKHWLTYKRHQKNIGFEGNFLSGFDLCKTNYLMFISDEDYPNLEFVSRYNAIFNNPSAFGVLRPSIGTKKSTKFIKPINACKYPDKYFKKGAESIRLFGLSGNYLSGVIYNKVIFDKFGFRNRLASNLDIHRYYPHLYLNCLFCAVSKTKFMSDVSAFEGQPEIVNYNGIKQNDASRYTGAYTYGSRLDQFVALRDAFSEALDLGGIKEPIEWVNIYLTLVAKYFNLIMLANIRLYHDSNKIHFSNISKSFAEFAIGSIRLHPVFARHGNSIVKSIEKLQTDVLERIS